MLAVLYALGNQSTIYAFSFHQKKWWELKTISLISLLGDYPSINIEYRKMLICIFRAYVKELKVKILSKKLCQIIILFFGGDQFILLNIENECNP